MTTDPHLWAASLPELYSQVWTRLSRGVADRRAPTRHPTLATVSADGRPHARTVVLRGVDTAKSSLEFHTDLRSDKIAEIGNSAFAAVHIWDASAHLQIRLEGSVSILQGAEVAKMRARVPHGSRLGYGIMPSPGTPIASALAYEVAHEKGDGAAFFGVLRLSIESIDVLHLGASHRRARFDKSTNWSGQWVVP